jgi:mannose-6-phosphate isomerase-like protein (cupin superfamily)
MSETPWTTIGLPDEPDTLAPDGSEIRVLAQTPRASTVHARLQPGATSKAIRHRTVDEIWYVLAGQGELWRQQGDVHERVDDLRPGVGLTIPVDTSFQFRNTGDEPLDILVATIPPWPGEQEAQQARPFW